MWRGLAVILLAAGCGVAQQYGSDVMHPMVHQQAQMLMRQIHQFNEAQIAMSQMALRESRATKVRRLATLVVRYHTRADHKAGRIAALNSLALNSPPPSGLPPMLKNQLLPPLPDLSGLQGEAFDSAFLQALANQDQHAAGLLTQARPQLNVARLKDLIGDMVPILKQERAMAQSLGR